MRLRKTCMRISIKEQRNLLYGSTQETFVMTPTQKNKHTFACTFCTVRLANICTAVTCKNEQEHNHLRFTMDSLVPRRPSRVPKSKYLQTYFDFISILISHSVCLYPRLCERACASACMYFVRAAC